MFKHLLCDLDGTLIDSSDGILETLRHCLIRIGRAPRVEISSALIGPPLSALVTEVVGSNDALAALQLEAAFRDEYDKSGYLSVRPYPGIGEALDELRARAITLHVVTNKRSVPTGGILQSLGWSATFATVNTLDSTLGAATKTDVVAQVLSRIGESPGRTALIGDSIDDAAAARENGIAFGWASWGYGRSEALATCGVILRNSQDVLDFATRSGVSNVSMPA